MYSFYATAKVDHLPRHRHSVLYNLIFTNEEMDLFILRLEGTCKRFYHPIGKYSLSFFIPR